MNKGMKEEKSRGGFTLAEVMVTLTILSLVLGMVLTFTVENLKASFVSEQKNKINYDIRKITNEMFNNSRDSNYFLLYKSFDDLDRNEAGDRLGESNAGDFLVLVYQSDPDDLNFGARDVEKIIGYYLTTTTTSEGELGPLRTFTVEFSPASDSPIEDLLPDSSEEANHRQIVALTEGLADGYLFYNFWNKSVMINGKLYHGHTINRITKTYNFTVTP